MDTWKKILGLSDFIRIAWELLLVYHSNNYFTCETSKQHFMHFTVVRSNNKFAVDMPGSHANSKRSFNCLPNGC